MSNKEKWSEIPKKSLEDFNQKMDFPPGQEFTVQNQMISGIVWVLMGLVLINLEIKAMPWVSILGWLLTSVGLVTMAAAWVLICQEDRQKK